MKIDVRNANSLAYYTRAVMFYEWHKSHGTQDLEKLKALIKSMEVMLIEGPDYVDLHLFFKDNCVKYMEEWGDRYCEAIHGASAAWLSDVGRWPTQKQVHVLMHKRSQQAEVYSLYND
jgi:hypothetical protein